MSGKWIAIERALLQSRVRADHGVVGCDDRTAFPPKPASNVYLDR
jgi:hypothetical protein